MMSLSNRELDLEPGNIFLEVFSRIVGGERELEKLRVGGYRKDGVSYHNGAYRFSDSFDRGSLDTNCSGDVYPRDFLTHLNRLTVSHYMKPEIFIEETVLESETLRHSFFSNPLSAFPGYNDCYYTLRGGVFVPAVFESYTTVSRAMYFGSATIYNTSGIQGEDLNKLHTALTFNGADFDVDSGTITVREDSLRSYGYSEIPPEKVVKFFYSNFCGIDSSSEFMEPAIPSSEVFATIGPGDPIDISRPYIRVVVPELIN